MKKRKSLVLVTLLLLVGLTSIYVAGTYAKYTEDITGKSGSLVVAKWNFAGENSSNTLNVNLDETYDTDTLVSGKIAPGTSGSFSIALTNDDSEVGVTYELEIGTVTSSGNASNSIPENLKFYTDSTHSNLITSSNKVTGTLDAGDSVGTTATIYWEWAYETTDGDTADTNSGKASYTNGGTTLTVPVTITGTQVVPAVATP